LVQRLAAEAFDCSPTSSYRGADLNRNFGFQWGCCGGSSGNQCSQTYRGPSPASEPEVQAVQDYVLTQFPDQRGPGITDPAPDDATGIYIDVHSYSELVLWPWGFTSTPTGNGTQLQTLGRKFAHWNGYWPEQAIGLYPTDGTTDDFVYGELGVAAYTFELGTTFFQDCNTFENTILPDNMPALIYAAKVARTPYMTPAGPDAHNLSLSDDSVPTGTLVTLSGTVNDTRYNNSNGTESTQNIIAAEYYVDVPPWIADPTPVPIAMSPSDGSFNSSVENVAATVDTSGLSEGQHIIFVRGQDANGNWGAFSAIFLSITANTPPTICALPNQVFDHTTSLPGTIDLWACVGDAETPTDELTYIIEGTPPAGAGVTLDDNRTVTIHPSATWCGGTDVTIRVTDPGGLWDSDTFRVAVTWSCQGPLPVANQYASQDQPITIDLTAYEPQIGDGTAPLPWYATGEDHCAVSGEYSVDDVLTFAPEAGFVGSDRVTLHMVYPWGRQATQELTLTWGGGTCNVPDTPVLTAPADGAATDNGTPTFEWGVVTDAEAYQVQADEDASFSSPEIDEITVGTDYTPATGLNLGVYYWRVRASNGCGAGSWSPVWEFTIHAPSLPEFKLYLPVVARDYR